MNFHFGSFFLFGKLTTIVFGVWIVVVHNIWERIFISKNTHSVLVFLLDSKKKTLISFFTRIVFSFFSSLKWSVRAKKTLLYLIWWLTLSPFFDLVTEPIFLVWFIFDFLIQSFANHWVSHYYIWIDFFSRFPHICYVCLCDFSVFLLVFFSKK